MTPTASMAETPSRNSIFGPPRRKSFLYRGAGEEPAFKLGPVGTTWIYEDERHNTKRVIVAIEPITIPYGGTYTAYKYKQYNINDPNRRLRFGMGGSRFGDCQRRRSLVRPISVSEDSAYFRPGPGGIESPVLSAENRDAPDLRRR